MEEDIKILEELIAGAKAYGEYEGNKYYKSMENLITRYKELEKYKKYYETEKIIWSRKDYISKSKVKEKIEEIKNTGIDVAWEQINYSIKEQDRAKIQVLQELLED